MERYIVGSIWDRVNRHGVNSNFEYLFEGSKRVNELNKRADDVLSKSYDVLMESKNINDSNVDVQNQIDNLILDQGQSDVEVVNARGEYDILRQRLDAEYENTMKKESMVINASDFGAVGDNVADDTTAIQEASDYAKSLGTNFNLFIPKGNYKTSGTIEIVNELDASQATINYHGTELALKIGDDSAQNIVTSRRTFNLPRVIFKNRVGYWDDMSEGVKCINLNTCNVYAPFIRDFSKGLIMYGEGGGNAYNTVFLGALWENRKNLVLDTNSGGYTNQNLFLNGRLQHSLNDGAFENDPEACQIYMATPYGGGPNNNTFLNTSIEGENASLYRVDVSGKYNQFINCRWEAPSGVPKKVRYRSTAQWNKIEGGYAAQSIEEVFDGNLPGNSINDNIGAFANRRASGKQVIPDSTWTTITSLSNESSRRVAFDNGVFSPRPGKWLINANAMFTSNANGIRQLRLLKNRRVEDACTVFPDTTNQVTLKVVSLLNFNPNDTFELEVYQTSGGDLELNDGVFTKVEAEYLGY